jgi:UDP-glucose 4-epimerase
MVYTQFTDFLTFLAWATKIILQRCTKAIFGNGEQTRDFIHACDVANGVFYALINEGLYSDCFNICTGMPTSINRLVDSLKVVTKKDLVVTYRPSRQGEIIYS